MLSDMIVLAARDTGGMGGMNVDGSTLDSLPVLRWADVTGPLSNRTDGVLENITSMFTNVPSNIEGTFLSLGNNLWSAAARLNQMSSGVDLSKTFGPFANRFAASVYASLTGDWLAPSLILLVALMTGLVLVYRGQGMRALTRRVGCAILGLALFLSMGAAAAANPTVPSPGTPWWVTDTASSVVGTVGGSIADGLNRGMDSSGGFLAVNPDDAQGDRLSCRRYVGALRDRASSEVNDPVSASLSRMWEETGLRLWTRAQYGTGDNGLQVFCRVLEARAGANPKEMAGLTSDAAGGAMSFNYKAAAWWPRLLIIGSEKPADKDNTIATSKQLDRYVTIFDVCGLRANGSFYARPGWRFVNAIPGTRGLDGARNDLPAACEAITTGTTNAPGAAYSDWTIIQPGDGDRPKVGNVSDGKFQDYDASENHAGGKQVRELVEKFDINGLNSSWQTLVNSEVNNGDGAQRIAAANTYDMQRGNGQMADVGGAFLFVLAGLVNFVIWGLVFGLMRLVAVIASYLLSGLGLYVGFLVYAILPDKGGRALSNTVKHLLGACAGGTVIGLMAAIVSLVSNAIMMALGIFDQTGNTSATVTMMAVASLVCTPAALKLIQYVCVNVWGIGDPFSIRGMMGVMSGKTVFGGMKATLGAVAGGIGAAVAGGGLLSAVSGMANGARMGAHARGAFGAMAGAAGAGVGQGRRDRFFASHTGSKAHGASKADLAAGTTDRQRIKEHDTGALDEGTTPVMSETTGTRSEPAIVEASVGEWAQANDMARREAERRAEAMGLEPGSREYAAQAEKIFHGMGKDGDVSRNAQRLHELASLPVREAWRGMRAESHDLHVPNRLRDSKAVQSIRTAAGRMGGWVNDRHARLVANSPTLRQLEDSAGNTKHAMGDLARGAGRLPGKIEQGVRFLASKPIIHNGVRSAAGVISRAGGLVAAHPIAFSTLALACGVGVPGLAAVGAAHSMFSAKGLANRGAALGVKTAVAGMDQVTAWRSGARRAMGRATVNAASMVNRFADSRIARTMGVSSVKPGDEFVFDRQQYDAANDMSRRIHEFAQQPGERELARMNRQFDMAERRDTIIDGDYVARHGGIPSDPVPAPVDPWSQPDESDPFATGSTVPVPAPASGSLADSGLADRFAKRVDENRHRQEAKRRLDMPGPTVDADPGSDSRQ